MKTPLPLAKKARLAFLMLSSIHLVQERLGDQSAPRHLAEVVRGNFRSPAWICMESAEREGEMVASHLSAFRARPWEEVYSLMKDICDLQSGMFVERVRMSSAWAKAPKLTPEMEGAQVLLFSSRRMGSMTSRKRVGERTDPCRTP